MNFSSNATKALLGAAVIAGAVSAIAQPASAISFSVSPFKETTSSFRGVTTGNALNPLPAGATVSGGAIVSGSLDGVYKAPGTDSGTPVTSNYLTTIGNNNPVEIALKGLKGYFGFYWGSIDKYNTIEFFKGGNSVGLFDGANIIDALVPPPEGQGSGNYNSDRYVNFFGEDNGDLFDTVVLNSGQPAFEVANIATRTDIPTPALLPGLIGMGVAAWRKRKGEAAQAEA